jgi:hypothetical protein
MPIGSETIPSGAQRLSSRPGASGAVTLARPAFERLIAESGEYRTTVGVKGGTGSTTSGRTATEAGAEAGDGVETDWQPSAVRRPADAIALARDGKATPFER